MAVASACQCSMTNCEIEKLQRKREGKEGGGEVRGGNERVIASTTVVAHLRIKLNLAFYPLVDANIQG